MPNPAALTQYYNLLNQAQNVASTPYQPYTGELVAPVNAQEQQGIAGINQYATAGIPGLTTASNMFQQSGTPLTAQQIQNFYNPYNQQVVQATENQFNQQNQQQQNGLLASLASQGALGGSRTGVAQATLAGQQQMAQAPVIAGLEQSGYNQALQTAAQQYQQNPQAAAFGLANAANTLQNAGLTGANAQVGAGTLQQQTQQAADTAALQQYLQQQAYPFQTLAYQTGIDTGVGSLMGGTSSGQTTTQGPSALSQVFGGLTSGLSLLGMTGAFGPAGYLTGASGLFSDRRMKKDIKKIGKLKDGQDVYRFRYKDDPDGRMYIGLMAQEVEKKHPEAVGEEGGYKFINVKEATDSAARANGGLVTLGKDEYHEEKGVAPRHLAVGGASSMYRQQYGGGYGPGGVSTEPYAGGFSYIPNMNITRGRGQGAPEAHPPAAPPQQDTAQDMFKQASGLAKNWKQYFPGANNTGALSQGTDQTIGPPAAGQFVSDTVDVGNSGIFPSTSGSTSIDPSLLTTTPNLGDAAGSMFDSFGSFAKGGNVPMRGGLGLASFIPHFDTGGSLDTETPQGLIANNIVAAPPSVQQNPVTQLMLMNAYGQGVASPPSAPAADAATVASAAPEGVAPMPIGPSGANPAAFPPPPPISRAPNVVTMPSPAPSAGVASAPRAAAPSAGVAPLNIAPNGTQGDLIHADERAHAIDTFSHAIAGNESRGWSNPYEAVSPPGKHGNRSYGKYQVEDINIGPWTKEVLGSALTPEQFMHDPKAQEAVFRAKFGQLVDRYGPDGAAARWFAGPGWNGNPNANDGYHTVSQYVANFNRNLGNAATGVGNVIGAGVRGVASVPGGLVRGIMGGVAPNAGGVQQPSGPFANLGGTGPNSRLWPMLAAMGSGMLSSNSPFFGVGLGRGIQAGLGELGQLNAADLATRKEAAEEGFKNRSLDLEAQKLDQEVKQQQAMLEIEGKKLGLSEETANRTANMPTVVREVQTPFGTQKIYAVPDGKGGWTELPGQAEEGNGSAMQQVKSTAEGIMDGTLPPVTTGRGSAKINLAVNNYLHQHGFNLTNAQLQYDAAKKQVLSLNGPQMVRYSGLAHSVINTIDEVNRLAQQLDQSGVPLYNRTKLQAYVSTAGNTEKGQLITRYLTSVNTLKEEFANLAQGGYAPTDAAWDLANQQINGDYGVKQLGASLGEVQRLLRYRLNAIPNFNTLGPNAANRYTGNPGQPSVGEPVGGASTAGGNPATQTVPSEGLVDRAIHGIENFFTPPAATPTAPVAPPVKIQGGNRFQLQPDGSYKYIGKVQ